jgi:hypothetical protein
MLAASVSADEPAYGSLEWTAYRAADRNVGLDYGCAPAQDQSDHGRPYRCGGDTLVSTGSVPTSPGSSRRSEFTDAEAYVRAQLDDVLISYNGF